LETEHTFYLVDEVGGTIRSKLYVSPADKDVMIKALIRNRIRRYKFKELVEKEGE